jgi:YegS/Rv2252/BmrU family lipid kinase
MELAQRRTAARLSVILNASAGTAAADRSPERLRELLSSEGVDVHVVAAESGQDVLRLAREELARGADTVVAAGGDGTVNAVASLLAGTDRVLGVLPLGTLNHFARDLGIPADLEGAARVIREESPRAVDVGEVNGRIFLNNSSLGLYTSIVRHREKQQVRLGRGKWAALFWATLRVLRHGHKLTVHLRAGEEERSLRTYLVFVGNNEYEMEGFQIGTRRTLDGGVLSLYLTRSPRAWALILLAVRAIFGRLHESRDFEAFHVPEARIETRRRHVHVAIDGEVSWFDSPLRFRIRPLALRIIAPAARDSEAA